MAATWPHTRRWKPQTRAEKAYKLLARDQIRARVAELEAIAGAKLDAAFALIADGSMQQFVQLDEDGQPTITLKGATEAQLYSVGEIVVADIVGGKRTRLKLGDRIAAEARAAHPRSHPRTT